MIFDDSRIQNLVNASRASSKIQYENVPFSNLQNIRVVGLVTIKPKKNPSSSRKVFIPLLPTVFLFE
jgi:hypothetical protein